MLVDPMNQIHAIFTPITSLLYRYLDFNRVENNCMHDCSLRFILSPNPTKEKGAKSFILCILHWVNNSWDPAMKKSSHSFSDFRKYIGKCKRGSSPYFTGFFQPGFPCCPNFSDKDPLFTLTLGHWIRIQWLLGLSRQGLQVKTSFPYWAKTQRQNSIKRQEPALSTWRKATPWVRREAGDGKLAFQPSSDSPSTPWAPVPAAIINWRAANFLSAALKGPLHLHPTRERTASLTHSLSRGIFLCLELQIQNCAENILRADPTQGTHQTVLTQCGSGTCCPCVVGPPQPGLVVYTGTGVCSDYGWQHPLAHHTDPFPPPAEWQKGHLFPVKLTIPQCEKSPWSTDIHIYTRVNVCVNVYIYSVYVCLWVCVCWLNDGVATLSAAVCLSQRRASSASLILIITNPQMNNGSTQCTLISSSWKVQKSYLWSPGGTLSLRNPNSFYLVAPS